MGLQLPQQHLNLAYNIYSYGGGADFRLTHSIDIRARYEYHNWMGFPLGMLHPGTATVGFACHFHERTF
jgi:opacity protein-like surface antigen